MNKTISILKQALGISSRAFVQKLLMIALFIATVPFSSGAQIKPDNQDSIKIVEAEIVKAKADIANLEKKIITADALIQTSTNLVRESENEIKSLALAQMALNKEYYSDMKPLEKQAKSLDKETATQAKSELKSLDLKYKADQTELDNKRKVSAKKNETGKKNLVKGTDLKKQSQDNLVIAKDKLKLSQEKLVRLKS